jgi:hypothetical protein
MRFSAPTGSRWPDARREVALPILEGIGLNITAWSYVQTLGVSLLGSPVSVPDPWLIVDALHQSLSDLKQASDRAVGTAPTGADAGPAAPEPPEPPEGARSAQDVRAAATAPAVTPKP